MFKIYCPIIKKFNNKKLHQNLILHQKQNPCCSKYPSCKHPKLQSYEYLHHNFLFFEKSLNSIFKNVFIERMWSFITYPNNKVNTLWHDHGNNKNKFSSICYLNETTGTEFEDNVYIEPEINTWYIWESHLKHRPINKKVNDFRINIVADIYIK